MNRAHFAHLADEGCTAGLETTIHRAAKQIIDQEHKLWLPAVIAFPFYPDNMYAVRAAPAHLTAVDRVDVEQPLGDVRPDLIVWRRGRPLAVEIIVTHPVGEEKANVYRWLRISALAIDLKRVARDLTLENLRTLLCSPGGEMSWVHNEFAENLGERFRREAVCRSLTWRKSHKRLGMVPHVDSCPVPPRVSKTHGTTFANAKLDCPGCAYNWPRTKTKKIYHIWCAGHLASQYPTPENEDWLKDADLEA